MRTSRPVLAASTVRILIYITAQLQGTTPLISYLLNPAYVTIGTTPSMTFVPLYTSQYTIDFNGVIVPQNINLYLVTNNDANAECKLQISGDRGVTFVDMTDAIPTGFDLYTIGPGAWIDNIAVGSDGLQLRVLGRSTNGANATIKIAGFSFIDMTFNKKLV